MELDGLKRAAVCYYLWIRFSASSVQVFSCWYQKIFFRCQCLRRTTVLSVTVFITEQMTSDPSQTPPPVFMSLPRLLCTILLFLFYTTLFALCIWVYRRGARGKNPSEDPRSTRTLHPPLKSKADQPLNLDPQSGFTKFDFTSKS